MRYRVADLSANPRITKLAEVFREGSAINDPSKLLYHHTRNLGGGMDSDALVTFSQRDLPAGKYKITRKLTRAQRLAIQADSADLPNPWRDWASIPVHEGGLIGEIMPHQAPVMLVDLDASDDPLLGDIAAGMRSAVALPHFDRGKPKQWALLFFESPEGPDLDLLESGIMYGSLLGMATRNLVSTLDARKMADQLSDQLEQVANVQRALLPTRVPKIPGLRTATSYLTSDKAGGDYYDFFRFCDRRWGILIADVAGHGAAAATVMAMLRAIMYCYEGEHTEPAAVMDYANRKLLTANLVGSFITAFFAIYDADTGALDFALCGHNPPRLRRACRDVIRLEGDPGLPLGIDEDLGVRTAAVKLDPGDTLVLYTDGITEAFNPKREMFGTERLDEAIGAADGHPERVVDAVHSALYKHTGVMDRDDDQTMVILQRLTDGPCK